MTNCILGMGGSCERKRWSRWELSQEKSLYLGLISGCEGGGCLLIWWSPTVFAPLWNNQPTIWIHLVILRSGRRSQVTKIWDSGLNCEHVKVCVMRYLTFRSMQKKNGPRFPTQTLLWLMFYPLKIASGWLDSQINILPSIEFKISRERPRPRPTIEASSQVDHGWRSGKDATIWNWDRVSCLV